MSNDDRINDLLVYWQERWLAGDDVPPESLCADCPELIDEVRRGIRKLKRAQPMPEPPHDGAPPPPRPRNATPAGQPGDDIKTVPPAPGPAVPARSAPLPSIPGYEILGVLGRGGMGVVYKARQTDLQRLVALKMILHGSHASEQDEIRFRTEAVAVARLQHPNIVQIHEIGECEGRPFFSLEYVEGGSLADKLKGTPLPARQAAQLVETLARAMHVAHGRGIVHRDLKPGNILLASGGRQPPVGITPQKAETPRPAETLLPGAEPPLALDQFIPKIADFGLAKKLDELARQTASGAIVGTPSYMAPEQAGGKVSEIGPAADIYALGAVLYELLTGRPPFKADNPVDTVLQVLAEEPVPPSRLQPKVPRDVETICLKCLQKAQGRRYLTAEALADDLRHFLNGEPITARPVGHVERGWRWCRRNPALAAATVLAFGALLGVIGVLALYIFQQQEAAATILAEKGNTEEALQESKRQTKEAKRQTAIQMLERGLNLCEGHEEGRGLPWLARSLQEAPADDGPLQATIRGNWSNWRQRLHPLHAVLEHKGSVRCVAFSPDGNLALTSSEAMNAQLWSVATGLPHGPRLLQQGWASAVAFSPDGRLVLRGSGETTARLWSLATGQPHGPPLQHQGLVAAVAFSPDGKLVLTGSGDSTARLWAATTGQPHGPLLQHEDTVFAVAFSPDGRLVLTGSGDSTARLWSVATGLPHGPPLQHQGAVVAVAFSPDGRRVLTGSQDSTARLWSVATGLPHGPPLQHQGSVQSVAFSPDGLLALTGSDDHAGRLWSVATGLPHGPPLQHQARVWTVAFSPNGQLALTGSADGTARLWWVATGRPYARPLPHQGWLRRVAFSPDGRLALTAGEDSTARLWSVTTGLPHRPPLPHRGRVVALAFSPDGQLALTGSDDQTARLWSVATGLPHGPPLLHQSPVHVVAFSPDGNLALTLGQQNGVVRLWSVATGQPHGPPLQHQGGVNVVAFSPDGKLVLTGGSDRTVTTVRLWSVATGQPHGLPLHHQGEVNSMAISPDGQVALTGSFDGTARLWSMATGQPHGPPLQQLGMVSAVAFSPDGQLAFTGSYNGTARLWSAATGLPHGPPLQHQGAVLAVAFSLDSRLVLTGSGDSTARLWSVATGLPHGPPLLHQGSVVAVAFSPDGRLVLTGSNDKTARLWPIWSSADAGVEKLALETAFLTGMQLDEQQAIHVLDSASWNRYRKQWADLNPLPTGVPPAPDSGEVAWHETAAGEAESSGATFAALWHLDRLIALQPAQGLAYAQRANVYLQSGRSEQAQADLRQARKLAPRRQLLDWFAHRIADSTWNRQWPTALCYLDHSIALEAEDWQLYRARARANDWLSKWWEAESDLVKAVELCTDASGLGELGAEESRRRQWDSAALAYAKAAALRPQDPSYWRGAGWALAAAGRWAEAAAALDKVVKLNGPAFDTLFELAYLRLAEGDEAGYRQACALQVKHFGQWQSVPQADLVLAACALAPGSVTDYAPLLALADRAVAEFRAGYWLSTSRGVLLLRTGRYEQALQELKRTLALRSPNFNIDFIHDELLLSQAYARLGQKEEARRLFNEARMKLARSPLAAGTVSGLAASGPLPALACLTRPFPIPRLRWEDRVRIRQFYREAEELLRRP